MLISVVKGIFFINIFLFDCVFGDFFGVFVIDDCLIFMFFLV